jgi:methyl-accepting chemotaxis protein
MDAASTAINAIVITAIGALLAWFLKGQFDAIGQRFDAIGQQFDAIGQQFDAIDLRFDEVGHRIDRVEERLDRLRSDLTQVALAVGVRPRATNR